MPVTSVTIIGLDKALKAVNWSMSTLIAAMGKAAALAATLASWRPWRSRRGRRARLASPCASWGGNTAPTHIQYNH